MDVSKAIKTRRSIRRFEREKIARAILMELIEAGRYAPSAANRQPVEYIVVDDEAMLEKVFENLSWAAYVQPRRIPPAGRRPVAYIVVLINTEHQLGHFGNIDAAAAIENIILDAWGRGIGSCWLGSVKKDQVRKLLAIPAKYEIEAVIALGWPDENPTADDCTDESIRYYLDEKDTLHVPKRPLAEISHINGFGNRP